MKNHYITAVLELLKEGKDGKTVLRGLSTVLEAKHHEKLLPSILKGVVKELESSTEPGVAVVIMAEAKAKKTQIEEALKSIEAPSKHEVVIDDTIIGGVIATYNNRLIDNSYKSKLVSLYRNIQHN